MIKSKLFVVADRAIRDSESGNLSIINILDDVIAEAYPLLIARLTIIAFIEKTKKSADNKINLKFIIKNNRLLIGNHTIKVDFRDKEKTRAIIQLNGVPFHEPGKAQFLLTTEEDKEIDSFIVNLKLRNEIKVTTE